MTTSDRWFRRPVGPRLVDDAQLEPDRFGADGDRLVHHRTGQFGADEHVDDVEMPPGTSASVG